MSTELERLVSKYRGQHLDYGGNNFAEYQLIEALISLYDGAGGKTTLCASDLLKTAVTYMEFTRFRVKNEVESDSANLFRLLVDINLNSNNHLGKQIIKENEVFWVGFTVSLARFHGVSKEFIFFCFPKVFSIYRRKSSKASIERALKFFEEKRKGRGALDAPFYKAFLQGFIEDKYKDLFSAVFEHDYDCCLNEYYSEQRFKRAATENLQEFKNFLRHHLPPHFIRGDM